jgi:hypothetical protein
VRAQRENRPATYVKSSTIATPTDSFSTNWRSRLSPPTSIAAPMTSRMLPMIEPISDALTTS